MDDLGVPLFLETPICIGGISISGQLGIHPFFKRRSSPVCSFASSRFSIASSSHLFSMQIFVKDEWWGCLNIINKDPQESILKLSTLNS